MKVFTYVLLTLLAVMSVCAQANEGNQFDYYGIAIQNHSYDNLNFSPQFDAAQLAPSIYKSKDSSVGWRGFVGHQFNHYLALEAGITKMGKGEFSVSNQTTDANNKTTTTVVHQGSFSTLAGDVRAIATYPISQKMFLKASLGAMMWNNKFSYLSGTIDNAEVKSEDDTGISALVGFGLGYGFNKKVAIAFDYERTKINNRTTQSLGFSVLARF